MAKTNKSVKKMKFRKIAGGPFHIGGKVYKVGDIIETYPDVLKGFPKSFQALITIPDREDEEIKETVPFRMVHKGGGKYNVVNTATDKPINDVLLSKADALALLQDAPVEEADEDDATPEEVEENKESICPHGYDFGYDFDEYDECENCKVSKECQAENEEED